jgi:hypothetical protein
MPVLPRRGPRAVAEGGEAQRGWRKMEGQNWEFENAGQHKSSSCGYAYGVVC